MRLRGTRDIADDARAGRIGIGDPAVSAKVSGVLSCREEFEPKSGVLSCPEDFAAAAEEAARSVTGRLDALPPDGGVLLFTGGGPGDASLAISRTRFGFALAMFLDANDDPIGWVVRLDRGETAWTATAVCPA